MNVQHIEDRLRTASQGDRRLDCEVTLSLIGPVGAYLDELPGPDGWDIMVGPPGPEADVWLAADQILYATEFMDAAVELADLAFEADAARMLVGAIGQISARDIRAGTCAEMAGYLARQMLVELLQRKAKAEPNSVRSAA